MKWTLIFALNDASVQAYIVDGEPVREAVALKASPGNEWLRDYALIAAVPGVHTVLVRDDAHSIGECTVA